ncbi:hypothetical protein SEA_THERESITA_8 [Microbacterium phage Theresita]|nr:hypothetical protein SEA_THERESITA_8 [Microbacterium phage Theresita]
MAITKQSVVVAQDEIREDQLVSEIALFNPDGTPFAGGDGPAPEPTEGYTGDVIVGSDILAFEDGVLKTVTPA